jgi:hypothetical protein
VIVDRNVESLRTELFDNPLLFLIALLTAAAISLLPEVNAKDDFVSSAFMQVVLHERNTSGRFFKVDIDV